MLNPKSFSLAGAFLATYIAAMILLVPARYIVPLINLPPSVQLYSVKGTFWRGSTAVLANSKQGLIHFDVSWQFCLAGSFPFYAECIDLEHSAGKISAKIVGWPTPVLRIINLRGEMGIAKLTQMIASENKIAVAKPTGTLKLDLKRLRLNFATRRILSWRGSLRLQQVALFNVPFPNIRAIMTEEPFISRDPTRADNLVSAELPTFKYVGDNDKMAVSGVGQFFEDGQMKHKLELKVLDSSLRKLLRPLATSQKDNALIMDWQGNLFSFASAEKK